jgi:hypothetical protein
MAGKTVKVNICDYCTSESAKKEWLENVIGGDYELVFRDDPDFLFCFCYGSQFLSFENCVKIFFYGENVVPDFNYYDYAVGFHNIVFDDRHLYIPNYAKFLDRLSRDRSALPPVMTQRKFCNFIYNNPDNGIGARLRQEFCKKLMAYRHVDCPGKVLNNMRHEITGGYGTGDKVGFQRDYKFTIAFENTSEHGYTTEKLCDAFMADSVPIYWGNPDVTKDFNPRAFINCNEYGDDFNAVIKRVIELDGDDDMYMAMLRENPLNMSCHVDYGEKIRKFIANIFEKGNKPFLKDGRGFSITRRFLAEYSGKKIRRILFLTFVVKHFLYRFLSFFSPKRFTAKAERYQLRLINLIRKD